jgi:suppressor of ftsI
MTDCVDFGRRRFLKRSAIATFALEMLPGALLAQETEPAGKGAPGFEPDVELLMTARAATAKILPGRETGILRYEVSLVKGPPGTVTEVPGTYLAPAIRLQKGQRVRVRFRNELPDEDQIVHWHGLHVPEVADGHPRYAVGPGGSYVYEFEVLNRAGTYFYHSHTNMLTGPQVYRGLAGLLIVGDDDERALGLPAGAQDIPVVIQDRRFDDANQLVYLRHHMEAHTGFLGDRIFVNGRPDPVLPVETRPYRLRLANLSNSRIYKLAWKDGTPLTAIATDGGLLAEPVQRPYLTLAPAERVDIFADFRGRTAGSELAMVSLPFSAGLPGMMMHHMGGMGGMGMGMGMGMHRGMGGGSDDLGPGAEEEGRDDLRDGFTVFRVRIERSAQEDAYELPRRLAPFPRYRPEEAENSGSPRAIELSIRHGEGFLNGRSFEMTAAAPDERIPLGSLQMIEFVNPPGRGHGMMAALPHPMHIHGQQFQILRRESFQGYAEDHAELAAGFIDEGLKDTVLVLPGQRVTLLKRFDKFPGLLLYHCHNLEHEDGEMMRNFLVFA